MRQIVKGLIAQVSIVREFTGSLVPVLQNSVSQSTKLNPASGEMFLARSRSPIPTGSDQRNLITEDDVYVTWLAHPHKWTDAWKLKREWNGRVLYFRLIMKLLFCAEDDRNLSLL